MSIIIVLLRMAGYIFKAGSFFTKAIGFIYKWIVKIASNPIVIFLTFFEPIIESILFVFFGIKGPVTQLMEQMINQLINKMVNAYLPDYNPTDYYNSLPDKILQISCWLGATEALQLVINGIVSAMVTIMILQINNYIIKYNFTRKMFGTRRYNP